MSAKFSLYQRKNNFFTKCIDKNHSFCYNIKCSAEIFANDAAMAQLVEHILGKDEVPGPNPGSSSRQPRCSKERRGFGFL